MFRGSQHGGSINKRPLLNDDAYDEVVVNVQQDSPPIIPVYLKLQNVSYTVNRGKALEKEILHNITETFKPGQITALMGPSGAGKTTTLRVMSGRAGGFRQGDVLVNNSPVGGEMKKLSNYIPQDDILLTSLTPRETLRYAAQLRLPDSMSLKAKFSRVDEVLELLSLTDCADTPIGDVEQRGLSGGQRKRTSIALEVLTNPSVLFVDEPTSGLDSKTAEDVVRLLRELAHQGRTVICTIHQPSYQVFSSFDRLLLLAHGNVAYSGPMEDVEAYFTKLGHAPPAHENPADFYMRVLQQPPAPEEARPASEIFAEHWRNHTKNQVPSREDKVSMRERVASGPSAEDIKRMRGQKDYETSLMQQTSVLFRRGVYDNFKDRSKFVRNLIMKMIVGVLVGVVWFGQGRDMKNENIFPITGAMFMTVQNSVMDTMFSCVLSFPLQKALLRREYSNASYSLLAYYISTIGTYMLVQAILGLAMGIPLYFLVGLQPKAANFGIFIATMVVLQMIGVALGILIGSLAKDIGSARQLIMPTLVPLLLFSGYVIPYNQLFVVFKVFYWASFFQYGNGVMQMVQFRDLDFPDCVPLPGDCGPAPCFRTGLEYLKQANYDPSDVGVLEMFGLMGLYFLVLSVLGYWVMRARIKKKVD